MSAPRAYYNEVDPYAAQWLRNLIAAGHIMAGDVDERSIVDVRPSDVAGYTRCHFFAGIGAWDYALGLAGWPAERPVWTGSCPCQPFSKSGSIHGTSRGLDDERHLWPAWFDLIRQCRPDAILGEQVPVAIKHGWLDLVVADLEGEGYAVAPLVFEAAAVGEPIARERLWFAAEPVGSRVARQLQCSPPGTPRSRRWGGEKDLRAVVRSPFVAGDCWPAPLVRRVDHGFAGTVGGMSAYGNAINAEAAAAFIGAYLDATPPTNRDRLLSIAASAVPALQPGGRV